MSAVAFPSTAVPVTTPLGVAPRLVAPKGELAAILRPFILVGAVAFVIGFVGFLVIGRPHPGLAPDRYEPPAAVSTPAATPTPDLANPPRPV